MEKLQIDISGINIKDERIFRLLFELFYPRACAFTSRVVNDSEAGADIAQEAFLYIWQKVYHFHNLQAFKSYLYQVLKNKCLNHLRSLHETTDLSQLKEKLADQTAIEHLIIEHELRARIFSEINHLEGVRREIMLLRLEGKSYEEISVALQLSINTIKTYKKETYKQLRIRLSDLENQA